MNNNSIDKLKNSVEFYELVEVESSKFPVVFRSNQLQSIEAKYSNGQGVRVLKDNKIGFSSATGNVDIKEIFENAISVSKFSNESKFKFPDIDIKEESQTINNRSVESLSKKDLVDIGNNLLDKISKIDNLQIEMDVSKSSFTQKITNSLSVNKEISKTILSIGVYAVKVESDGLLWVGDHFSSYEYNESRIDNLVETIKRELEWSKNRSNPFKSKKMSVIFPPPVIGFLLNSIEMGVNAKNHVKKVSPLYNKLGEKILGDNITIIDTVSDSELLGGAKFDREGISTQDNYLFKNGEFSSIISDIENANILGIKPTGNATGSYSSLPSIGVHSLSILPGKNSFKEIIKDLDEAIYVEGVLGGGQSNMLAGDFAVNINLGYHVIDGEIKGRVKNLMVSGNVYEMLKDAILSSDVENRGYFKAPYIVCQLNVSL